MAHVMFRIGDILESSADLTVLPCSTKGHISTTAEARVQRFQLPLPSLLSLGEIEVKRFPGRVSRIIVWAASVNDRRSNPGAIRSIGERLGSFANENRWIQVMESPLLGTGAGGLDPLVAGQALRDGFLAKCTSDAMLIVYGQTASIMHALRGFVDDGKSLVPDEVPRTISKSGMERIATSNEAPGVFISYSHRDRKCLDELRVHLKPLERNRYIHPQQQTIRQAMER
jgi:hypothetical protein